MADGSTRPAPPAGARAPLGRVLKEQITSWIMDLEDSYRCRGKGDVFERLIGQVEKIAIEAALRKKGFVQTETARFLGLNRNTLSRKIKRYKLDGTARK